MRDQIRNIERRLQGTSIRYLIALSVLQALVSQKIYSGFTPSARDAMLDVGCF
jgi:hypothetical protein